MGHPELKSDESVLLATQNIVVKSVPFEAILTNERLILVNSKDTLMPPQYLPLAAIMGMDTGENAIRDPTITFSVATEAGTTRQMVLTFSRQAGGERRRECDEWARVLRERLAEFAGRSVHAVAPVFEPDQFRAPSPVPPAAAAPQTGKKRIEIARPMKKIIETVPAPQKPKETSSLPQGSFCSRCGNRVPPDSAFCNRCGTRVGFPPDQVPSPSTAPAVPPETVVPQVSVNVQNAVTPSQGKERPIEEVIHSIEPLIEDSKPRTQPAPLVPSKYDTQVPPVPPAAAETDPARKSLELFSNIIVSQDSAASGGTPPPGDAGTVAPAAGAPATARTAEMAPSARPPRAGMPKFITYAIIAVVVIAIILGGFALMKGGGAATPPVTPAATTVATPVPATSAPTVKPTPVSAAPTATPVSTPTRAPVPQNGVWVHVNYDGSFTGSYGTPGSEASVTDSGDHFYQVPTLTGIVVASFTKNDGSADPILVEVYKNGAIAGSTRITSPKGTADIQVDLKPAATSTLAAIQEATTVPTLQIVNSSGI